MFPTNFQHQNRAHVYFYYVLSCVHAGPDQPGALEWLPAVQCMASSPPATAAGAAQVVQCPQHSPAIKNKVKSEENKSKVTFTSVCVNMYVHGVMSTG